MENIDDSGEFGAGGFFPFLDRRENRRVGATGYRILLEIFGIKDALPILDIKCLEKDCEKDRTER